jgi:uncharacterized protein DUF3467
MEKEKQKINMNISDLSSDFYAHEASINFNPTQFIFDFKCVTPRIDPRIKENTVLNLKHNIVMVDSYHAKRFHELLGEIIANYEKEFGKIEKPKQMQIIENKNKRSKKGSAKDKSTTVVPSYLG